MSWLPPSGSIAAEFDPPPPEEELKRRTAEEFAELSDMLKAVAARAGVELDLSGIDPDMEPADFQREMEERFRAALEGAQGSTSKPARKQEGLEEIGVGGEIVDILETGAGTVVDFIWAEESESISGC